MERKPFFHCWCLGCCRRMRNPIFAPLFGLMKTNRTISLDLPPTSPHMLRITCWSMDVKNPDPWTPFGTAGKWPQNNLEWSQSSLARSSPTSCTLGPMRHPNWICPKTLDSGERGDKDDLEKVVNEIGLDLTFWIPWDENKLRIVLLDKSKTYVSLTSNFWQLIISQFQESLSWKIFLSGLQKLGWTLLASLNEKWPSHQSSKLRLGLWALKKISRNQISRLSKNHLKQNQFLASNKISDILK